MNKDFIKDLFTLRTVWIDKGSGRWVVKKRLHPILRSTLWVIALIVGAGVYSSLNNPVNSEAEAVAEKPVIRASLPEPDNTPPVQAVQVIPLKRSEIILPSEMNPETDRIIAPSTTAKSPDRQKARANRNCNHNMR